MDFYITGEPATPFMSLNIEGDGEFIEVKFDEKENKITVGLTKEFKDEFFRVAELAYGSIQENEDY